MKNLKTYSIIGLILPIVLSAGACKKILSPELPIDQFSSKTVYEKASTAALVMNGVYAFMQSEGPLCTECSGIYGLLSDELFDNSSLDPDIFRNGPGSVEATSKIWDAAYRNLIYRCNAVIEGVTASELIPDRSKGVLVGEAKFTRAVLYFYLINLFGDVPLTLTTDYRVNSNIGRTPTAEVYDIIVNDLVEAQQKLPENYLSGDLSATTSDRIRPTQAAATAFLARVYLYLGRWQEAEKEATKVIQNIGSYDLVELNKVFTKDSQEAIWQLQPDPTRDGGSQRNTLQAYFFIPNSADDGNGDALFDIPSTSISDLLYNSFEPNDKRKDLWIKKIKTDTHGGHYYIPFKYTVGKNTGNTSVQTEYTTVLRLSEQFLIRAEARTRLGNINGTNSAEADLNKIRARAGLDETTASTQSEMLQAISNERYLELFTEFGHRWFDLKRNKMLDSRMNVVSPLKGTSWDPRMALLGIPYDEFRLNPALTGHQNPGYSERK